MKSTILFLGQLLECTAGLSVTCVPDAQEDIAEFLRGSTKHIFDRLGQKERGIFYPLLVGDAFYEHSILGIITFLLYADKGANVVYIWGPVLTKPFSRENIVSVLEQQGIFKKTVGSVAQYCAGLSVVSGSKLRQMGELIVSHLADHKKPVDISREQTLSYPDKLYLHQAIPPEENISQMRQVEMRYEHSAALTDAIKQGNLSLALHMIEQYSPGEQTMVRNANPLRNAQNYCIVLNTQLRHALEETGIHPYRVDRLSSEIGLEIEQMKSISQAGAFFQQIIRRYCRLVQEHTYPNLKPLVNLAVTYIKEHLADNLTVKDTAGSLTVNANYLSGLFHKEMGMTFIDFVNKERTRQAAALLKHTNLQIQQVASMVGYNNTSYFAKQFLRFQGLSPSQYRRG